MRLKETKILIGLSITLLIVGALYLYLEQAALTSQRRALPPVDLAGFSIYMHRKGCEPGCASYAVLAKGSGELEYEGVASVQVSGGISASLSDAQLELLYLEVHRSGLLQVSSDHVQGMVGCREAEPGADRLTFGVTLDGDTRVITYYTGCEKKWPGLDGLAERIDEILDTRKWTGSLESGEAG